MEPIWKNTYQKRFDEVPLTIVKDLNSTLKVELIKKPEITGALREFVDCGSLPKAPDFSEAGSSLADLIKSNALWQGLETLHFDFKVTGCSRMLTHQLVRQRIGITFSQQCSDSVDWRHQNIVLPRALDEGNISMFLELKRIYARYLDSRKVSCQEARYVLPQCLETFIYIHVSLATIITMIKKRACTMSQPWETYLWAIRTRIEILKAFPELLPAFTSDCKAGKCFYHRAKENPTSAYLYQPDKEHGNFNWDPASYVYSKTHAEMSEYRKRITRKYYFGKERITASEYGLYAESYGL